MADLNTIAGIGIPTTGILTVLAYMGWQIRGKQNKDTCAEIHRNNQAELMKSDIKFEKINDILVLHTETLGRIDEKLKFIAEKNGYKGKE